MDRHRRRRRLRWARNGLIAAWGRAVGCIAPSTRQQADPSSEAGETMVFSYIPEDIQRQIHTLMPLRDAARAACVSRAFLSSWRSRPNLTLSKETLGLDKNARAKRETAGDFPGIVDRILKKHSGHMKRFELLEAPVYNAKDRHRLNSWLHTAVTPGIEELTLSLTGRLRYEFPCSLLSNNEAGDSIRSLCLSDCALRPTAGLGCFKSLTKLSLLQVLINGDELGCFLSNAFALESLEVFNCSFIECMKIPRLQRLSSLDVMYCDRLQVIEIPRLQRLSFLDVMYCDRLQVIESKAPNLTNFCLRGEPTVRVSLGQELQVKDLYLSCSVGFCVTKAELTSSSLPSIETLGIHSNCEIVKTPLARTKLLHLKYVCVFHKELTFDWRFDHSSPGSCPSLQTFVLDVSRRIKEDAKYETVRLDPDAADWVHLTCHMLRAWLS